MPVSLPRQFFKASCTLLEYGTEGGGSLNAGGGGGTGQVTLSGGKVVAQPVALRASASSSSPGQLFAFLGIVDRSYDIDVLAALGRASLFCAFALQLEPGDFGPGRDTVAPLIATICADRHADQQHDQLGGDAHASTALAVSHLAMRST